MATNTAGTSARQDPRQVVNTMRGTIDYNTTGVSSGVKVGTLPQNAFITGVILEVVTAFNAGSTNVVTVGTNSTSYNNLVASSDVDETATGATRVTRGLGRSLTASADVDVYAMYAQTGTSATTGRATFVIEFEGGWSS